MVIKVHSINKAWFFIIIHYIGLVHGAGSEILAEVLVLYMIIMTKRKQACN